MSRDEVNNFDPERLRRARRKRHLTLDALGELIGVRRPTLIAYEKGAPGRHRREWWSWPRPSRSTRWS